MITVPEATKKIIERSRYLSEAMSKDLINYSALARYIKPELDKMLVKNNSISAIIMAIKRVAEDIRPKFLALNLFETAPDMIVRSNLSEISVANSLTLTSSYNQLLAAHNQQNSSFFTLTEGLSETTIITSHDLKKQIKEVLKNEKISFSLDSLSAITIRLPEDNIKTPGVYYFFLKSLAWEGVNIIEVISTPLEITLILQDKEVDSAFSIIKGLFATPV